MLVVRKLGLILYCCAAEALPAFHHQHHTAAVEHIDSQRHDVHHARQVMQPPEKGKTHSHVIESELGFRLGTPATNIQHFSSSARPAVTRPQLSDAPRVSHSMPDLHLPAFVPAAPPKVHAPQPRRRANQVLKIGTDLGKLYAAVEGSDW